VLDKRSLFVCGISVRGTWREGSFTGNLGLISTQREAGKLISGLSPTVKTRLLSFNRTHSRVVIGLFIGHNTIRRYFYLM
jgi:hypothetical protein